MGYLVYYGDNHPKIYLKLRNQYYEIKKINFEKEKTNFLYFYFRNPNICLCSKKQFYWSFSSFFRNSSVYDFDLNYKIQIRSICIFASTKKSRLLSISYKPKSIEFTNYLCSNILQKIGGYLTETDLKYWMLSNKQYYQKFIKY